MSELTVAEFVNHLADSQLLTDAQLQLLKKQLVGNPLTAEGLSNVLVRQKHLTPWQAYQLKKGQTGFVLQQYRLLNPVGRGGMGHVFRSLNTLDNSVVAVKVMARRLAGNQTLVSRFRREIRASSLLNSPHIVRTLDAGRVGRTDFMVMEYVNGDQVDRIANRLGRVPVALACEMIRQIAAGLQHAHQHQMVHRDIKPANMMVHWQDSSEGIVKLMDMGLVLLMADTVDEKTVTRAGQVMGTPDYMSPEQGWDTTQVDIRSDIYSLGCTFFRLLTGQTPFKGTNPLQVLSQRMQRDAPSVLTICSELPPPVAAIVSRMTARDPAQRFQTPAEIVAALEGFCQPLTRQALRAAARLADDQSTSDIGDPESDDIDESDGTYRQFLSEVQHGSTVDLMFADEKPSTLPETTSPATTPPVAVQPLLNIDVSITPEPRIRSRAKPPQQRQSGLIAGGITAGLIVLIMMFLNRPGSVSGPQDSGKGDLNGLNASGTGGSVLPNNGGDPAKTELPEGRFLNAVVDKAHPGKTWTFVPKAEIFGKTDDIRYEVDEFAPAALRIDSLTGRMEWPIPETQSVGPYSITLRMVQQQAGVKTTMAETAVRMQVAAENKMLELPKHRPFYVEPDEAFQLPMAVETGMAGSRALSYRITGETPTGMMLEEITGQLNWTVPAKEIGRIQVTVAVYGADIKSPLATSELTFLVLPSLVEHVLPAMSKQMAVAGQPFRLPLPEAPMFRGARSQFERIVMLGPDAPEGMKISEQNDAILWDVPSATSGVVLVSLTARLEGLPGKRVRPLSGSSTLQIEVSPAVMPPTTKPAIRASSFTSKEIDDEVARLRETYDKTLVQARTLSQKTGLAYRLLEVCHDATPGITDAALLKLIDVDLAQKARATDVLLETARLRAIRYGGDPLAEIPEILKGFRRTNQSAAQTDMVIEHCLRLTATAIETENIELIKSLLETIKPLVRSPNAQGAAAQLMNDVSSAADLAKELVRGSDGSVDRVQVGELNRLVNRWQFQPLFLKNSGAMFVQVATPGTNPVPDSGRSAWSIRNGNVRLKSTTAQAAIAFLDPTQQMDRFVVRLEVLPATNTGQFVFGAGGSNDDDFRAFAIVLDSSALGRVHEFRSAAALNENASSPALTTDHANLMEIAVDGTQVVFRVNGAAVSQARVPNLTTGWLGLAADIRRPDPQFIIRNARILKLPTPL